MNPAMAAPASAIASGQTDSLRDTMTLLMIDRCSSGISSAVAVNSSDPPSEMITSRLNRQQYPASRRIQRPSFAESTSSCPLPLSLMPLRVRSFPSPSAGPGPVIQVTKTHPAPNHSNTAAT